jgi:hypothetical protein
MGISTLNKIKVLGLDLTLWLVQRNQRHIIHQMERLKYLREIASAKTSIAQHLGCLLITCICCILMLLEKRR